MLRICPTCNQSVIDEDVTECPFCGASMSGKPGAKKSAPASPQKAAAPKPKPAKQPKDDSPFEQTPAKSATAIQAAPKPMKGRLYKVVCPMCDVPGFIPKKAAGRDVRCPNKQCMVPVFKAPEPRKKVVEAEPETQSNSMVPIIAGIVLLLVAGGVGFALMGGGDDSSGNAKLPPLKGGGGNGTDEPIDPAPTTPAEPVEEPKTAFELREEVFAALQKAAEGNRKVDRPFCRRMEAEAFAVMARSDDEVLAKAGLARLGTSQDYFEAFPMIDLAWRHLAAGDTEQADAFIQKALSPAGGVSTVGRSEFDIRISLAAALMAAGKADGAIETIDSARDIQPPLDLEAARAAAALAIATTAADMGARFPTPVTEWRNPLWCATAVVLCLRDRGDAAIDLANSIKDTVVLADTLSAIAAVQAANGRGAEAAVKAASGAAMTARVNAAAAYGAAAADRTKAGSFLDTAVEAAKQLAEPKPMLDPTVKAFYESEYPEPTPGIMASLAFGEIARAEAELDRESAAETLLKAMYHAHSFCHSPGFSATWAERVSSDPGKVRATLARELNLNAQATRTAMNRFKRKVSTLEKLSAVRFDLESDLLARIAASKLSAGAWALTNPATLNESLLKRENVAESPLPWRVARGMLHGGADGATDVANTLGSAPDPVLQAVLTASSPSNSPQQAGRILSPASGIQVSRLRPILEFTGRFVSTDVESAIRFAKSLQNDIWRREMLRLIGARAGRTTEVSKLDEIVTGLKLEPPDRTAIYRGLIVGLTNNPEFKPPAK